MAQLPSVFNPNAPGQERAGDFSAIDPGDYQAQIIDTKMKETAAKTGSFLEITWEVISGEMAGRRVWSRLNLVNPSVQAVEIAQKHLASICDATGVPGPISDSSVLHGKPCVIKVIKKPATATYPEGNEVKNYAPIEGAAPTVANPAAAAAIAGAAAATPAAPGQAAAPAVAAPAVATPAPAVAGKPPWVK